MQDGQVLISENDKVAKVVGKMFLMIKNGPGFMVSQMHSLFKWCGRQVDIELTYEIATQSLMTSY